MRPRSKTVSDLENRAAFLVQLRAFLLQAKQIALTVPKDKRSDLHLSIDAWLTEVGDVGQPLPSIVRSPLGPPAAAQENAAEADPDALRANTGASSPQLQDSLDASRSRVDKIASSFTVDMMSSSGSCSPSGLLSNFDTRNLEDLAEFLAAFFASGIPEGVRLRAIGRNAARLTIVRCFSIIANTLQQVVRVAYATADDAHVVAENSRQSFVQFAHEIAVCANAVLKCMQLLTAPTDTAATRFATQVCVDILTELRQCIVHFKQHIVWEELNRSRSCGAQTAVDSLPPPSATTTTTTAAAKSSKATPSALPRAAELRALFGSALLASIDRLMGLVGPAVRHLVSAASAREPMDERPLKADACGNLFALAEWVTPAARWQQQQQQQRRRALSDPSAGDEKRDTAEEDSEKRDEKREKRLSAGPVPDAEPLPWHPAAQAVAEALPGEFSPEYIACVAQHCGDEGDGPLVAVRIMRDTVGRIDVGAMRLLLSRAEWRRRLAGGVLRCLVALQPSVLDAGLAALQRLVAACPESLGSEIGFLYTSGVFRLLESDNTPDATKRTLLHHVVHTFFRTGAPGGSSPPLLLRLYEHFDLSVRWHQLNVVQQAVATLSKAVRRAAAEDFCASPGPMGSSSASIAHSSASIAHSSAPSGVPGGSAGDKASTAAEEQPPRPIPLLALHGLTLAAELLAAQAPADEMPSGEVPRLPFRDAKFKEQRAVDVINSAPLKGLRKLFGISDAEIHPSDGAPAAENGWAHSSIPPAVGAVKAKVRRVAAFLLETPSLNPESVADFLSHPAVFPLQVCQEFMAALPLAGKSIVDGLKELFSVVQSPKEGQRIERLLEFFCNAYYHANVGEATQEIFPFATENACFIVGVAILMLNTNLHNPHVSSAKMTAAAFHAQLRGCNDGGDFSERFTTLIFDEIRTHSLSGVKGFWSAGMGSGVRYASVPVPSKMDSLFFSSEERRELAFGVERQSLVSETKELIARRSRIGAVRQRSTVFWCAAAQDLFLSTWPSLCTVFGVAALGPQVPNDALLLCARGLRSSLIVAAAFGLQTECDVSLLALLRMSSFEPLRAVCHRCVLEVAASPHSVNFTVRCWAAVAELLVGIRKRPSQGLLKLEESVFARIEEFTREHRRSQENDDNNAISAAMEHDTTTHGMRRINNDNTCHTTTDRGSSGNNDNKNNGAHNDDSRQHSNSSRSRTRSRSRSSGGSGSGEGDNPLDNAISNSGSVSGSYSDDMSDSCCSSTGGDLTTTSANGCGGGSGEKLHRSGGGGGGGVEERGRGRGGSSRAVRRVLEGITVIVADGSNDVPTLTAALHVMRRALSYSLIAHTNSLGSDHSHGASVVNCINVRDFSTFILPALLNVVEARGAEGAASLSVLIENIVDVIAGLWAELPSPAVADCCAFFAHCFDRAPPASVLRVHVLQGVLTLMARTIATPPARAYDNDEDMLYTMADIWRRTLLPVARAVSERDCVSSETCSMGVQTLRKLVAQCCGVGGKALQVRPRLRSIALLLLSHVAYLGAMCSETDSAQLCLAQFSTICTTALNRDVIEEAIAGSSPLLKQMDNENGGGSAVVCKDPDPLRGLVVAVGREADVLVRTALESLCLTLRAHGPQTRADAVQLLRTIAMQLSAPQLCALAAHLSDIVTEATLGRAAPVKENEKEKEKDKVANGASVEDMGLRSFALFGIRPSPALRRCAPSSFRSTLPLALSFLSGELLSGAPAAAVASASSVIVRRCLVPLVVSPRSGAGQTRTLAARSLMHAAALAVGSGGHTCVGLAMDAVSLVLAAARVPVRAIVPPGAEHAGRAWVSGGDRAVEAFVARAAAAVQKFSEPHERSGGGGITATAVMAGSASGSGTGGSDIATDEQLVDYCTLMAQVLSPLPKVLAAAAAAANKSQTQTQTQSQSQNCTNATPRTPIAATAAATTEKAHVSSVDVGDSEELRAKGDPDNDSPAPNHSDEITVCQTSAHAHEEEDEASVGESADWALPHASREVLAALLLEAAGTFFAILWRVNSFLEMESFLARSVQKGREVHGKSVALLPHAAVRGCLHAHFALSLSSDGPPLSAASRGAIVEVLRVAASTQAAALTTRDVQKTAEGAAESAALQRLSPQEQQHIRSCNVGMSQELTAVIAHWVRTVARETNGQTSTLSAARREGLCALAADPEVFSGMVRLLTPTAGPVIVTVRDYFAWYIAARELKA